MSEESLTNPRRFLILWADSSSANLGVRVLAEGVAALLGRAWKVDPDAIEFHDFGPGPNVNLGMRSILKSFLHPLRRPMRNYFRGFSAVVDCGAGDSFSDIYGLKRLATMVYCQGVILKLGVPLFMAPQTIGPFRTAVGRHIAARTLQRANGVMARDSESAAVGRALGGRAVHRATDVVFALPIPVAVPGRDVVLNVSGLLWNRNRHVDSDFYQSSVRQMIQVLTERGRRVSLLVHVLGNASLDEDVTPALALGAEFGDAVEILIPDDLTHARALIASSRVLIGSRMHACLNALSVGVPCVAWAYSRKFAPLMDEVGWSHVLDLRERCNPVDETDRTLLSWLRIQPNDDLDRVRAIANVRLDEAVRVLRGGQLAD